MVVNLELGQNQEQNHADCALPYCAQIAAASAWAGIRLDVANGSQRCNDS